MSTYSPLRNVTIVGGSLAGLMHALTILTHSPKTKVTILERSSTALLHNQGAGVVAGSETQTFFSRYVCPGHEIAVRSKQRLYLNHNGDIVPGSVEEKEQRMTSWDVLYRLLRWKVDGMETEYISGTKMETDIEHTSHGKANYEIGCKVNSLEDLGSAKGVQVHYTTSSGESKIATSDLVIAADGGSSTVRCTLLPEVKRTYAGYVALRGTIPETELSEAASKAFSEKFAFFHTEGIQILAYLIPGDSGTLEPGKRLMNWVFYKNYEENSTELKDLMTDTDGNYHHVTLPVDGMRKEVWEELKRFATRVLPSQFAELVNKTTHPFVQAITDNISPRNDFYDGRVLLVGDALAGFRPHTAASTGQAAFDALTLAEFLDGKIDRKEYGSRVLDYAKEVQRRGIVLGERSQFGRHPFAG
jgi:2-polyprenyl-6-methoxyphenol hydroxylase-like FAD-dependent oxidoreductase